LFHKSFLQNARGLTPEKAEDGDKREGRTQKRKNKIILNQRTPFVAKTNAQYSNLA
jgi:hypothetical protein